MASEFQKLAERYSITSVSQIAEKISYALEEEDPENWTPKIRRLWKGGSVPKLQTFFAIYMIGIGCSVDELMAAIVEDNSSSSTDSSKSLCHIFARAHSSLQSRWGFILSEVHLDYEVFSNNDTNWEKSFKICSLTSDLTFLEDLEIYRSTGEVSSFSNSKEIFCNFGERNGFRREHYTNVHLKTPLQEGDEVSFSIIHESTGAEDKDANSASTKIRIPTNHLSMKICLRERKTPCEGRLFIYDSDTSYYNRTPKCTVNQEWNEEVNGFLVSQKPDFGYWYVLDWDA